MTPGFAGQTWGKGGATIVLWGHLGPQKRTRCVAGAISAMRVGRLIRSLASVRSCARLWCRALVRRSLGRCNSLCQKASCSNEKKPRTPGIARAMDCSSCRTLCQCLVGTQQVVVLMSEICQSRCTRCCGSLMVPLIVSVIQPSMVFVVDHVASPFSNFSTEAGSWW